MRENDWLGRPCKSLNSELMHNIFSNELKFVRRLKWRKYVDDPGFASSPKLICNPRHNIQKYGLKISDL